MYANHCGIFDSSFLTAFGILNDELFKEIDEKEIQGSKIYSKSQTDEYHYAH